VVEYTYDSWGKPLSRAGALANTLGVEQPFRYRGYVYDYETGFYYLQSRYYDPNTCRFISADVYLSTGTGVLGNNTFAYCNNNPVVFCDDTGTSLRSTTVVCFDGGGHPANGFYNILDLLINVGNTLISMTAGSNGAHEFGTYIYKIGDLYYYGEIIEGSHIGVYIPDKIPGLTVVATIHSHPLCTQHNPDSFSKDDIDALTAAESIDIYLASPLGYLHKASLEDGQVKKEMEIAKLNRSKSPIIDCRHLRHQRGGSRRLILFIFECLN